MARVKGAGNLLLKSNNRAEELEEAGIVDVERVEVAIVEAETIPEMKLGVDADLDEELLEIFLEEAQEIMEAAGTALQRWQSEPENLRSVAELQRELHTLKGGARMSEMTEVADLCHELESIYEGLHDGRVQFQEGLIPLLSSYHDILDDMLEQIRNGQKVSLDDQVLQRIHAVAKGASPLANEQESADIESIEISSADSFIETNTSSNDIVSLDLDESDREIL